MSTKVRFEPLKKYKKQSIWISFNGSTIAALSVDEARELIIQLKIAIADHEAQYAILQD